MTGTNITPVCGSGCETVDPNERRGIFPAGVSVRARVRTRILDNDVPARRTLFGRRTDMIYQGDKIGDIVEVLPVV